MTICVTACPCPYPGGFVWLMVFFCCCCFLFWQFKHMSPTSARRVWDTKTKKLLTSIMQRQTKVGKLWGRVQRPSAAACPGVCGARNWRNFCHIRQVEIACDCDWQPVSNYVLLPQQKTKKNMECDKARASGRYLSGACNWSAKKYAMEFGKTGNKF